VEQGEALGLHDVVIADHIVFPTTIHSTNPYTVTLADNCPTLSFLVRLGLDHTVGHLRPSW
jgi:hypothetical protein